jgi:hypothetical protein
VIESVPSCGAVCLDDLCLPPFSPSCPPGVDVGPALVLEPRDNAPVLMQNREAGLLELSWVDDELLVLDPSYAG